MKLYRVTCRGMTSSTIGEAHGIAYVIATDPTQAYNALRARLDHKDLGFPRERELDRVELIADECAFAGSPLLLIGGPK